ncbi:hypothetical protein [Rhodopseudomonas sp. BAL398]
MRAPDAAQRAALAAWCAADPGPRCIVGVRTGAPLLLAPEPGSRFCDAA